MEIRKVEKVENYFNLNKQRNAYMYKPHITRDKNGNTFQELLDKLMKESK